MKNPPDGKEAPPARAGEAGRQLIRGTRQVARRKFPAEEKIRIVLEGIRGEVAVSELCRREGIHPAICAPARGQRFVLFSRRASNKMAPRLAAGRLVTRR